MNHLPRPITAPYDNDKFAIRCYAKHTYDCLDFRSYPERCGWTTRSGAEWSVVIRQASEDFQSFLQKWLYFGVMQLFFRRTLAIEDLTVHSNTDSEELYLDSRRLPMFVEEWLADLETFTKSDYMKLSDDLAQARFVHEELRAANRSHHGSKSTELITFAEFLHQWPGGCDPRAPMMVEAQAALFDMIDVALVRAKELQEGSKENETRGSTFSFAQTQGGSSYEGCAMWDIMMKDGWCPSELAMIFGSFSTAGIYFASHIERPNAKHTHRTGPDRHPVNNTGQLASRSMCSVRHCGLKQLDQELYKTKHTEDCQGCDEMGVDETELLMILGQRKFPIVIAIDEHYTGKTIRLRSYNDSTSYVAISHVWADGLGNLAGNRIWRCQMLRMSSFAREILPLEKNVAFWLDTLCCPPDSMNRPMEQGIALDLMRDTYAEAHTVLVLDAWLSRQNLNGEPTVDALLKIICSPWTQRLWTLQEGALAKRLLINCADGLFDADHAVEQHATKSCTAEMLNIQTDILHRWYTIRGFKDLDHIELFHALYPSLAFRTTSVVEDEPLCLATLFRLPVAAIAAAKTHEERMLRFWTAFRELPAEIMDHYEPRLQTPGFRWAPRSFMSDDENMFPYSHKMLQHGKWPPAIRTERGLQVTARACYFTVQELPLTGPIYVRHPAGFWVECSFSFDLDAIEPLNVAEATLEQVQPAAPSITLQFSPCHSHGAEKIALLYHSWGSLEEWRKTKKQGSRITGNVASIVGFHEDSIIVRRFGLFVLAPIPQKNATVAALEGAVNSAIAQGLDINDIVLADRATGSVLASVLQVLPEDQTWLVD